MPAGRPRSDNPRAHTGRFRATADEHQQLLAAAQADGMPLGPWLREVALRAAKRTLRRKGR